MSTDTPTHHLSENDLQQVKRLVLGAFICFLTPKFFDWNYGSYFAVYPMIIMGLVPVLTRHIVRQFLMSGVFNVLVTIIIADVFVDEPVIMIILMMLVNLLCFWLMASGTAFLAGAHSVLAIHAMVQLGSYNTTDLLDLCTSHLVATLLATGSAFLAFVLFPDKTPRSPPPKMTKSYPELIHQVLFSAGIATISFIAFQMFDEKDSLSAQAATLLILFPLRWSGAYAASIDRMFGTLIGSAAAILMQAVLFTWGENITLQTMFYLLGVMIFAAEHIRERRGPARGFCSMTALAIFFGLKSPGSDVFYTAMYRLASVAVAVFITLMLAYLLHRLLLRYWPTSS